MEYLEQIEAYFNEELNDTERIAFSKELQNNEVLAEEVLFFEEFQKIVPVFGRQLFKAELQSLEATLQVEEKKQTVISIIDAAKEKWHLFGMQAKFTFQELELLFKPISAYDTLMATVSRSSVVSITSPNKHTDRVDDKGQLVFSVQMGGDKNTLANLRIENNLEEVVFEQECILPMNNYGVDLRAARPGRYYWKLYIPAFKSHHIGDFLIGKELLNNRT